MPPRPMPVGIATGLSAEDAKTIENTYNTLIEVCRDERTPCGDGTFRTSSALLSCGGSKVNRILANRPG